MNEQRRFLNQSQPQTLVVATILLYFRAFLTILSPYVLFLLIGVAMAAGGYGIANERRWGYTLALFGAVANVVVLVMAYGSQIIEFPGVITLLFNGAIVFLLIHPESRNYQRIYFR